MGVRLTVPPTPSGDVTYAVFDDTCGMFRAERCGYVAVVGERPVLIVPGKRAADEVRPVGIDVAVAVGVDAGPRS